LLCDDFFTHTTTTRRHGRRRMIQKIYYSILAFDKIS